MAEGSDTRRYRAAKGLRDFTAIPNGVLRRKGLSGNAKALYAIILDIVLFRDDEPDLPELGALLGGGEKTARTAIRELVDADLAESKRRGRGLPNAYVLLEPAGASENGPQGRSRTAPEADPRARDRLSEVKHTDADASVPATPKLAKIGGRNLGLDALCEECGIDPSGNRVGQAVAALNGRKASGIERGIRELVWRTLAQRFRLEAGALSMEQREKFEGVVADEVREKARLYRQVMKGATLTPTALARWWTDLALQASADGRGMTPDDIMRRYAA